jgi:transcriptional regulator with XRE-family HTH domain
MPQKIFYVVQVPPPTETIRTRVRELFKKKAAEEGLTETAFSKAMGMTTPSWANHFLAGRRNVSDITLLARIARFFGVSVAFLIGETHDLDDARISAILVECKEIAPESLPALLTVAKTLPRKKSPHAWNQRRIYAAQHSCRRAASCWLWPQQFPGQPHSDTDSRASADRGEYRGGMDRAHGDGLPRQSLLRGDSRRASTG